MRFLRPLLGFTSLDRQRNPDVLSRSKVSNLTVDVKLYQRSWLGHQEEWTETAYENKVFSINPGDDGMVEHAGKMGSPRTRRALKEQVLRPNPCVCSRVRRRRRRRRNNNKNNISPTNFSTETQHQISLKPVQQFWR
jgi:hypothetical protein